jgi:hypothetical protein
MAPFFSSSIFKEKVEVLPERFPEATPRVK